MGKVRACLEHADWTGGVRARLYLPDWTGQCEWGQG